MSNETILIVEDEGIIAAQLQNTLTGLGYTVHGPVNSGEAALAAVMAQPPDLILMDIKLAGAMDGIAAAGRIRSAADIPIVYLTSYSQDLMFQQAKVTAPYGYLVKPVGKRELAVTLEMALYRHTHDRRLRESEEKWRSLVNILPDYVSLLDSEGRFLFLNHYTEGFTEKDVIGSSVYQYLSTESKDIFEKEIAECQNTGKIQKFEHSAMGKHGIMREYEDYLVLILEKNKVTGTMVVSRDITERKQFEETLRKSEENFRRSLDDSPLGVRVVSDKGETIYANRQLLDFYGYDSVEELNKIPIKNRYTCQSYAEFKLRRKIRDRGEFGPSEYEIAIIRKNGEIRYLQVFRKAILWNGEKQFQTLYRDITEEKKRGEILRQFEATIQGQQLLLNQQSSSVEELIARLTRANADLERSYATLKTKKDDLVRSEKLAFTGRMAAGIAHEIRNPLTNVILSIRQLKKDGKIKPEGLKYAGIVENNTNRIEYLITELLNCARPIKLNLQLGDIHLLIKDILNIHKVRLKTQRIKVSKSLTAHPSVLFFDKEQLGRVLLNLIANAIEAMHAGGKLSIVTRKGENDFVIKIQDNGSGIPENNLIKIFDPFFTTKKQGTGLGLSTCQNIVASHGGLIEVESSWRKGSVFSVSLPLEPKRPDDATDIKGNS